MTSANGPMPTMSNKALGETGSTPATMFFLDPRGNAPEVKAFNDLDQVFAG